MTNYDIKANISVTKINDLLFDTMTIIAYNINENNENNEINELKKLILYIKKNDNNEICLWCDNSILLLVKQTIDKINPFLGIFYQLFVTSAFLPIQCQFDVEHYKLNNLSFGNKQIDIKSGLSSSFNNIFSNFPNIFPMLNGADKHNDVNNDDDMCKFVESYDSEESEESEESNNNIDNQFTSMINGLMSNLNNTDETQLEQPEQPEQLKNISLMMNNLISKLNIDELATDKTEKNISSMMNNLMSKLNIDELATDKTKQTIQPDNSDKNFEFNGNGDTKLFDMIGKMVAGDNSNNLLSKLDKIWNNDDNDDDLDDLDDFIIDDEDLDEFEEFEELNDLTKYLKLNKTDFEIVLEVCLSNFNDFDEKITMIEKYCTFEMIEEIFVPTYLNYINVEIDDNNEKYFTIKMPNSDTILSKITSTNIVQIKNILIEFVNLTKKLYLN